MILWNRNTAPAKIVRASQRCSADLAGLPAAAQRVHP